MRSLKLTLATMPAVVFPATAVIGIVIVLVYGAVAIVVRRFEGRPKMKTIENRPMPDYFNREAMIEAHGSGFTGMFKCIGWGGLIAGIIGGAVQGGPLFLRMISG